MPFPLVRRRSVAVAAPPVDEDREKKAKGMVRRASFSHGHSSVSPPENAPAPRRMFLNIFRRGSESFKTGSSVSVSSTIPEETTSSSVPEETTDSGKSWQTAKDEDSKTRVRVHSPSHRDHNDRMPQYPPAAAEDRQPLTIQDALELRIEAGLKAANEHASGSQNESALTKDDVKNLFSGAPHFMLEKGKRNHFYPQVIFPWDLHDSTIQGLKDRKPLTHRSFALSTLHPHVPVPEEWVIKGYAHPGPNSGITAPSGCKRATFDIGVFEVPNMLSMNGWERGSVGFRYYLELPTADFVRYTGPGQPRVNPDLQHLSSLPATTAFEMMDHHNDPYSECKDGTVHSRHDLLCEGPLAWKRIGLRDINFKVLVERLERLRNLRREALRTGATKSILSFESLRQLYDHLFTHFLFPPPQRLINTYLEDPHSLKSQIKVLTHVLATPGAWWDFSLVEWRFRVGQLLWEAAPHPDGDFLEAGARPDAGRKPWICRSLERKWFLLQMLLSAELLLRLDAASLVHGDQFIVLEKEAQLFNKLRSGKVNWDLVVVRRFLDSFNLTFNPVHHQPSDHDEDDTLTRHLSLEKHTEKRHFFSLGRRPSISMATSNTWSTWECKLASSHTLKQLEGLLLFAEGIGWPRIETLKAVMQSKIMNGDSDAAGRDIYGSPVLNILHGNVAKLGKEDMYCKSSSRMRAYLHCSPGGTHDANSISGWISRSWLSGFVLPGEGVNHLLMATILENDPKAMESIGSLANLYGGFLYDGRSWWSRACIVGRVLSSLDGVKECMGWMSCDVIPRDATTSSFFEDTWFEVPTKPTPCRSEKPRIEQGSKVIRDSTPVGVGALSGEAFSLPVDEPLGSSTISKEKVTFEGLVLSTQQPSSPDNSKIIVANEATVSFNISVITTPESTESPQRTTTISLPLAYNIQFISAHECLPPFGYASYHRSPNPDFVGIKTHHQQSATRALSSTSHTRVPGHPLHMSYSYRCVSLSSLPDTPAPRSVQHDNVMVIDARGCRNKETFARAWCASVGTDAVIGRVGRSCLACCIREGLAADVGVVIRVGEC